MPLALAALLPAGARDEAALKPVVEKMLAAYARQDEPGAAGWWVKDSQGLKAFDNRYLATLELRQRIAVSHVELSDVRFPARGRAVARLRFRLRWHDRSSGRTESDRGLWDVVLVQTAQGWRLAELYMVIETALLATKQREWAGVLKKYRDDVTLQDARRLGDLAIFASMAGHREGALGYLERTDAIAAFLEDDSARAYATFARAYCVGHARNAAPVFDRAATLFAKAERFHEQAGTLIAASEAAVSWDQFAEAERLLRAARRIAQKVRDLRLQAVSYSRLARLYHDTGRMAEATVALRASQLLCRRAGLREEEGGVLLRLGKIAADGRELSQAQSWYEEALRLGQMPPPRPRAQVRALLHLAALHGDVGRVRKAVQTYGRALELAEGPLKDLDLQVLIRGYIANVEVQRQKYDEAIAAYQPIIALARKYAPQSGHARELLCEKLQNLGTVYLQKGSPTEARGHLTEARELARRDKLHRHEAVTLVNLGGVAVRSGQWDQALACYRGAEELAAPFQLAEVRIRAGMGVGQVYHQRQRFDQAARSLQQAIDRVEQVRLQALDPEMRLAYFGQYARLFYLLADTRRQQKRNTDALAVSERYRARELVELLASPGARIEGDMTEAETADERALMAEVRRAQGQLLSLTARGNPYDAAAKEAADARDALETFRSRLYRNYPELRGLRGRFDPAPLEDLGRALLSDDRGVVLLSYLVDETDTLLFVLCAGRDGRPDLRVHSLGLRREALAKLVRTFRDVCSSSRDDEGTTKLLHQAGGELHARLIAPAGKALDDARHLILIPDGPLRLLPFAALPDKQGKFLLERYAVSHAPSATALVAMRELARQRDRDGAGRWAVVLGNPAAEGAQRLPHSEKEAEAVAALFKTTPLIGEKATRSAALARMTDASYVHLAAHGKASDEAPLYSHMRLAGDAQSDGRLYAQDLLRLRLKARLVVLSGCQTGQGREYDGEGVLGLGWALFAARTPSAMLSLWDVDDESTEGLMKHFYTTLLGGRTKAEALRQAQRALLKRKETRHPYHWAAFVLWGDWGR